MIDQGILARRNRLVARLGVPVLLFAGDRLSRNFRANQYPFRASSHFLYFVGLSLPGAVFYLDGDRHILFMDFPTTAEAMWHGEFMAAEVLQANLKIDKILPKSELEKYAGEAATIPLTDVAQRLKQAQILGRDLPEAHRVVDQDRQLAAAIIDLRLSHDAGAIAAIKEAIAITVEAHQQGMGITKRAKTEAAVRGAIEGHILSNSMGFAYNSIVSVHGEVLHNEFSPNLLKSGDLLLVDAGAETSLGWAADLTRTYPVNGKFSATQREIYDIILAAHDQAIAALKPQIEFRDIHRLATKVITEGLQHIGILQGHTDDLLAENITSTFFPHGIGHLMGLDVHDMEDLGDLAGYAPQRSRSEQFGECFLRLDRPLQANMIVTIEPGFYQVPAILGDRQTREPFKSMINWEKLEQFNDVRGIRIEDDILITANSRQNLSEALITTAADIEHFLNP